MGIEKEHWQDLVIIWMGANKRDCEENGEPDFHK